MKKKIISCILASVMAMSVLMTGCGQESNSATNTTPSTSTSEKTEVADPKEDQVHLKWALWSAESQPYWIPIADAYMDKNPNVTIEIVDLGSSDYSTSLATQLAGNDSPYDVVAIKDSASYVSLIQKGVLKPLDVSKVNVDAYGGNLELFKWSDGNYYTLPLRKDFYCVFYNKTMFDAAGVPYPTNDMTYEEFNDIARKLTDTSFGSEKYGTHYHTWDWQVNGFAVLAEGKNVLDGNYDYFKPYYEMVLAQQADGVCMDYATIKTSGINYLAAFGQGNVAMLPTGSWVVGTLITRLNEGQYPDLTDWGLAAYPHAEGKESGDTLGNFVGVSVVNGTKNMEVAEDFARFAGGEEGAKIVASVGYFPGALSSDAVDVIMAVKGIPQDEQTKELFLSKKNITFETPLGEKCSEVATILKTGHDYIMTGAMTVDEGIAYMNEEYNKLK